MRAEGTTNKCNPTDSRTRQRCCRNSSLAHHASSIARHTWAAQFVTWEGARATKRGVASSSVIGFVRLKATMHQQKHTVVALRRRREERRRTKANPRRQGAALSAAAVYRVTPKLLSSYNEK